MSFTDDADPVQSDGSYGAVSDQGEGSTGDSPYADYLNRIPEEARGPAEEAFKAWDANFTRKQQEAAEYRNRWQPFENHQPDEIQWGLDMRKAALENPQAVWEWAQEYAKEHNLVNDPAPSADANPQELTYEQWAAQQEEKQLNTKLEQQLSPLLQRLEQYDQRWQQMEEQNRVAEAHRFLSRQMDELKKEHPDAFKDTSDYGPEKMVERLSERYRESDPENAIPKAFQDWQSMVSQYTKAYAEGKLAQPAPPESGGQAHAAEEAPKTLADAASQAIAQLRAANRS